MVYIVEKNQKFLFAYIYDTTMNSLCQMHEKRTVTNWLPDSFHTTLIQ